MSLFAIVLAAHIAIEPPKTFPLGLFSETVSYCYDPPDSPPYKPKGFTCWKRSCINEMPGKGVMKNTMLNMYCTYTEVSEEEHKQILNDHKDKSARNL